MPPNPSVTTFQLNPSHEQEILASPTPNWPGNGTDPPHPNDWLTPQVVNAFNSSAKISLRPMPSKDRCFYMVLNEREINAYMAVGGCFGVEEAAVLEAEPRVSKQQQTQFIFKCIGRVEFVKPKFDELESDDENTTGS